MIEVTAPKSTNAKKWVDSEKLLEATLELGRNWTIAVVVASFTAAYWHKDIALESWMTRDVVFYVGAFFAIFWMGLAILRFMLVARFADRTWLQTGISIVLISLLVAVGLGLIMSVARVADNANAVDICSPYAETPEHGIHNDPVCQHLYELRAEKIRRLTGE